MHNNIRPGSLIYASDGQELGKVKEIRGDYFKVDASMAPDYWLGCDCITSDLTSNVRVSFTKDQLIDYKRPEPALI